MWFNNWLCTHLTQRRTRQVTRPRPPQRWHVPPCLEPLEDRTLLSNYTAATVSDLIADINAANVAGGSNTIALIAPSTSPYVLTAVNNSTDGPTGLPVIAAGNSLIIEGHGDTIERSSALGTPAFRLFDVASGATLTLHDLTLSGGLEIGAAAQGGAIFSQGDLTLSHTVVQNNTAQGSTGANGNTSGGPGATGGTAQGGGIYEAGGSLTLAAGTDVSNNQAHGGNGGKGGYDHPIPPNSTGKAVPPVSPGGAGGDGSGGGIYQASGSLTLTGGASLSNNLAIGGNGGDGGGSYTQPEYFPPASPGGAGGDGSGGGIDQVGGNLTITGGATLDHNQALGGNGGAGFGPVYYSNPPYSPQGGNGGSGAGGGLYASGLTLNFAQGVVANNQALGGQGGQGGNGIISFPKFRFEVNAGGGGTGGSGAGGGLDINASSGHMGNLAILQNTALGGAGGPVGIGLQFFSRSGEGGSAAGGGLLVDNSTFSLSNVVLGSNVAQGGNGANAGSLPYTTFGVSGGTGGNAAGGGLYAAGSNLLIANLAETANAAQGGAGGSGQNGKDTFSGMGFTNYGGDGAAGGSAAGGGSYIVSGSLTLNNAAIIGNTVQGGKGGLGGSGYTGGGFGTLFSQQNGGDGDNAAGGGLYLAAATVSLTNVGITANLVQGGAGGDGGEGSGTRTGASGALGGFGGNGGNALGGGMYTAGGTVTLTNVAIAANIVQGGNGGNGGNGGVGTYFGSPAAGGNGGNGGASEGGGIYVASGTLTVNNGIVAGNSALGSAGGTAGTGRVNGTPGRNQESDGGGIFNAAGTANLKNTKVFGNFADTDPDTAGEV
jgi:hypothetical protein